MGNLFKRSLGVAFLIVGLIGLTALPAAAQVAIPEGSIIDSAEFSIYVYAPTGRSVYIHRILSEWAETVVTYNSFNNSYDPVPVGGFAADSVGWKTVNITGLVQAWAAGIYPNFGIALVESQQWVDSAATLYHSSEFNGDPTMRPKLVISYTPPGGPQASVTIQRPASSASHVVDTSLFPIPSEADTNFGSETYLLTRFYGLNNKYSLIRFIYTYTPPSSCPGTGTPGYWMNHPEAWPEDFDSIVIGGDPFTKQQAIEWMMMPVAGDKTFTMFAALVAAKLNAAIGCATVCPEGVNVGATITAADAWMALHPVGSGVAAGGKNSPWRIGEPLYYILDQYNNGLLCVPHRD